jgi:hypothetical protein
MLNESGIEEIRAELLAFTDDPESVIIYNTGEALFSHKGEIKEINFKLSRKNDIEVEYLGQKYLFNTFIAKELARLDVFATKIRSNRNYDKIYVDSNAILRKFDNPEGERGLSYKFLQNECEDLPFATKITFITADAGHGKSSLLKEFQYKQAQSYLEGKSEYLFWHIDLQGRQLARLDEAIMADLGKLRLSGLFMSSIYSLIKRNLLIIAIDGFDELSVEQGSSESLGALAHLVTQLNNRGIIIAASRRTFFNHDDYIKKTRLFRSDNVLLNELRLLDWQEEQNIEYIKYSYLDRNDVSVNSKIIYSQFIEALHTSEHPFLRKPFLFTKIVNGLIDFNQSPVEFISNANEDLDGVGKIVRAFISREVSEKWKFADTNEPYLTEKQHMMLLANIANEMWDAQSEIVSLENIQLITKILCDSDWKILDNRKQVQISEMVRMHALLLPEIKNFEQYRRFEHQEFRNFFLAYFVADLIEKILSNTTPFESLKRMLSHSQLPDSVALYVCNILKNRMDVIDFLSRFENVIRVDWKASYLQINAGTFIPYIVDSHIVGEQQNIVFGKTLDNISNRITYSSLIFEEKNIKNLEIYNGNFINISLKGTKLDNCRFVRCTFNDLIIFDNSDNLIQNSYLTDCEISSVTIYDSITNEIVEAYYAPNRIQECLTRIGFLFESDSRANDNVEVVVEDTQVKKLLRRFLYSFNKTSIIPEYSQNPSLGSTRAKFRQPDFDKIKDLLIPILEKHEIIKEINTMKVQQGGGCAWQLLVSIEELFLSEFSTEKTKFYVFWEEINNIHE